MKDNIPTQEEIEIMIFQRDIKNEGYQWEESIFNDDKDNDCSLTFTKNKNPQYLSENILGDCGWGRFTRYNAWKMAHQALVIEKKEFSN